jgi:hypothetical protein
MRNLVALAVALLLGAFFPPPLSLPSLVLLLAVLTVLAPLDWVPFGSLGMPGDQPPMEGGAP